MIPRSGIRTSICIPLSHLSVAIESLDEGGFEPLTIESMRKNLPAESYPNTSSESLDEDEFKPLTI